MEAAGVVRELAAGLGAKPAQVALAWLLAKGVDIVPIPGTKRRTYLEENIAAADLPLTPEQVRTLDDALAPGKISGQRYNERLMVTVDR